MEKINSFGNILNNSASLNTEETKKRYMQEYLEKRVKECVQLERLELSKKAVDAGASSKSVIDKVTLKLEKELSGYITEHFSEIINNKYELLHISELEAKSSMNGYRTGRIITEIQHVIVFQRA